jgi:hypothetical protein
LYNKKKSEHAEKGLSKEKTIRKYKSMENTMDDIFAKIALSKIEEAIKNGEFENLSGEGKPVNLDYLASIPPEMRAAYTVLKNSGVVPEEVHLLKQINELREELSACQEGEEKERLAKKLMDTEVKYHLLIETTRRKQR